MCLLPKVYGVLTNLDLSTAGDKKIQIYNIIFLSVRIARQRRHKTNYISRTACAAEPRASLIFAVAGQRIRIEKLVAAQRNAGEKSVVYHPLQNVDIPGIAMQQKHAMVPHGIGDGGTCFAIGRRVRQLIIITEGFAAAPGADTTGDIQFLRNYIQPYPVKRFGIIGIACQGGNIRHAGIQIPGPDGMTNRLILLDYRLVVLAILPVNLAPVRPAPLIKEEFREIEVPFLAGDTI